MTSSGCLPVTATPFTCRNSSPAWIKPASKHRHFTLFEFNVKIEVLLINTSYVAYSRKRKAVIINYKMRKGSFVCMLMWFAFVRPK